MYKPMVVNTLLDCADRGIPFSADIVDTVKLRNYLVSFIEMQKFMIDMINGGDVDVEVFQDILLGCDERGEA